VSKAQTIKAIKLTVTWSLNCLHVIVCVAVRCPGELTKDLTLKSNAKAKDLTFKAKASKIVLEDISRLRPRPRTTTLVNTAAVFL